MNGFDEYGLGRLHSEDPRDHNFLMASAAPIATVPTYRYWPFQPRLNQGQRPTCVQFAWNGQIVGIPVRGAWNWPGESFYDAAQRLDEWPGEDYGGTSVRAGAKVLLDAGLLTEYRWGFDLESILTWIGLVSPVVLGTNWHAEMFRPDAEGILRVRGDVVGGHAYRAIGYNRARGMLRLCNSWSANWGQKGLAWLPFEDLEKLLAEGGEACTPIEARK